MKIKTKLLILTLALLLLFALVGCNNGESNSDPDLPNGPNTLPDLSEITAITAFPDVDIHAAGYNTLKGAVKDESHNLLVGVDLYFGENATKVVATDTKGEFAFCFLDPDDHSARQQADYLSLNSDTYDFKVIPTWIDSDGKTNAIACLIIACTKDKEIDFSKLIMREDTDSDFYKDIAFNVKFHENGILLPDGYLNRGGAVAEGAVSKGGETALSGVEVFLNGDLTTPIAISNSFCAEFEYLFVGDRLTFVKSGFTFLYTATISTGEGGEHTIESLPDNTYEVVGLVSSGFQIRGDTGGNINVLVGE